MTAFIAALACVWAAATEVCCDLTPRVIWATSGVTVITPVPFTEIPAPWLDEKITVASPFPLKAVALAMGLNWLLGGKVEIIVVVAADVETVVVLCEVVAAEQPDSTATPMSATGIKLVSKNFFILMFSKLFLLT
jgi:hypothetical protein